MTKSSTTRKAKKGISSSSLSIDPSDNQLMDVDDRKEAWCEYTLNDKTIIRLKPVIIEVRKIKNQTAPNGDPIYFVKSTVITDTIIPEHLKRKK